MKRQFPEPAEPASGALRRAHRVLVAATWSAESFFDAFNLVRQSRQAKGTTKDEEQDLLRAMLVFASAGLDSMIKRTIEDALPLVIDRDEGASAKFHEFAEGRLRAVRAHGDGERLDTKLLASVLTSRSPRDELMGDLIRSATAESLQSKEKVLQAAARFDIPSKDVCSDFGALDAVFKMRNQISHELDVDFTAQNRSRRTRTRDTMIKATKLLLQLGATFLAQVDKRLGQQPLPLDGTRGKH